ncbi:septation protein A [Magnetofaba australis]|uniref:Inner membrane-spanning protein YciB n=1 Tax=Magnetofaba australis IT-1 TaxID=1434232 RepID=A0A1Y2K310_9PROT|nr:septation protein A [Magnetofaba australis]OSM01554.1 putative intracellular septation protein A [Magnetofaba australis IT-1]
MGMLFELLPVAAFFGVYKLYGIYAATLTLIILVALQCLFQWIRHGQVSTMLKITFWLVLGFGGATLILRNPQFIMWKPTILQWLLALGFIGTGLFTDKPLTQRMLGAQVRMDEIHWRRLNVAWALFLTFSGGLNLLVAYSFSEATWVNFKLFGLMGLMLLFVMAQTAYIMRVAHPEEEAEAADNDEVNGSAH